MKTKIIIAVVLLLLLGAFLGGYIPQYQRATRLSTELAEARGQVEAKAMQSLLCAVRDQVAFLYVETSRKNYGLAAQHATKFFNAVRDAAERATNPTLKNSLHELLNERDRITAGLATGDPVVLTDIHTLFLKVHEITQP